MNGVLISSGRHESSLPENHLICVMIPPQISTFFWKLSEKLQKKRGTYMRRQALHTEIMFTDSSRNTFSERIGLWVRTEGSVTHTDMSEGNRNLAGPRWHGRGSFFPQCNKNSPLVWGDGGHAGALRGRIPSPHATPHCCRPAHFTGFPTTLAPWLLSAAAHANMLTC